MFGRGSEGLGEFRKVLERFGELGSIWESFEAFGWRFRPFWRVLERLGESKGV